MTQQVTKLVAKSSQLTWLAGSAARGVTTLTRGIVVGREPSRCDIVLESDLVSRQHARVVPADGGRAELIDLDSSNGTFVNGRRVSKATLFDGDKIGFGSAEEVHCIFEAAPSAPAQSKEPEPAGPDAVTAILSGDLKRCPRCTRVVTSALGTCRHCAEGRHLPSDGTAEKEGRAACVACGTPARDGGSFCHRCGARLTV